ncbi:transposase [Cupriavidus sp. P-10]|uniref:transposase n=1 Tax=Cupriavidus sp. P-10 TaxID=2027911 RepID=UPI001313ED4F
MSLVLEQGYSVSKAAQALGISETALRRWRGPQGADIPEKVHVGFNRPTQF